MTKRFKFCKKCETSKPLEDYYVRATGQVEAWCRPCNIRDTNSRRAKKRRLAREERDARPAPPLPTEKRCGTCRLVKPIVEFQQRTSTTWRGSCKVCISAYRDAWLSGPGRRESISASGRESAGRNKATRRARQLARYGLTPEDYDRLYDGQLGCCLICGNLKRRIGDGMPSGTDVLCVDHDHATGAVRGLLCSQCNRGIGLLKDDAALVRAALDYLERSEVPHGIDTEEGRRAG